MLKIQKIKNWQAHYILFFLSELISISNAKTIEPFYEDPFDIGAGGTVLTWATQESMLINNPALIPHGEKFFRWLGVKTNITPGVQSLELAQSMIEGESTDTQLSESDSNIDPSSELFKTPIHLGFSTAASTIINYGGIGAFVSTEPDIKYWQYGDPETGTGAPNIAFINETYAGLYASAATTIFDWLSFGGSYKYLAISEINEIIDLTNSKAIANLEENFKKFNISQIGIGNGIDVGSVLFLQGEYIDWRAAVTVTNLGGMPLSTGDFYPQMLNIGYGLTLHTTSDALHLSAEIRDLTGAMGEPLYRKVHLGARLTLKGWVGISSGIYHGNPTLSCEIDLIFMRLALSSYTREYSQSPGINSRPIAVISTTFGFTF